MPELFEVGPKIKVNPWACRLLSVLTKVLLKALNSHRWKFSLQDRTARSPFSTWTTKLQIRLAISEWSYVEMPSCPPQEYPPEQLSQIRVWFWYQNSAPSVHDSSQGTKHVIQETHIATALHIFVGCPSFSGTRRDRSGWTSICIGLQNILLLTKLHHQALKASLSSFSTEWMASFETAFADLTCATRIDPSLIKFDHSHHVSKGRDVGRVR